jgi:hypothetical protein
MTMLGRKSVDTGKRFLYVPSSLYLLSMTLAQVPNRFLADNSSTTNYKGGKT